MKPRQVTVGIEPTTDVAFDDMKKARGGVAVLKDGQGLVLCVLDVEQIQVNVIRLPKAKKAVRR